MNYFSNFKELKDFVLTKKPVADRIRSECQRKMMYFNEIYKQLQDLLFEDILVIFNGRNETNEKDVTFQLDYRGLTFGTFHIPLTNWTMKDLILSDFYKIDPRNYDIIISSKLMDKGIYDELQKD